MGSGERVQGQPEHQARLTEDLLAEQVEYYRARAPEYEQWWLRQGRYELDGAERAQWDADVAALDAALEGLQLGGRVLELACGTGLWTRQLVRWAEHVTAVDVATEVLDINRAKLPAGAPVTYVHADVFEWSPPERYDVVFFSFWLSHVPPSRFERFWDVVASALEPGGRAVFLDSRLMDYHEPVQRDQVTEVRDLTDGRTFRIVKVLHEPDELAARLQALGWDADVRPVGPFLIGEARGVRGRARRA